MDDVDRSEIDQLLNEQCVRVCVCVYPIDQFVTRLLIGDL